MTKLSWIAALLMFFSVFASQAAAATPSKVTVTNVQVQLIGGGTYAVTVTGTAQLGTGDEYVGFKCDLQKPDRTFVSTFANMPIPTPGGPAVNWTATTSVTDLGGWIAIGAMAYRTGTPKVLKSTTDSKNFNVP